MAINYEISTTEGSIRYSGRKGRPPADLNRAPAKTEKSSPVWPLAAVVFATALLQNDLWFAVACVLAQLSVMTALQWLVLFAQSNASTIGLKPFRTLPALKTARSAAFVGAMACALMLA